MAIRIRTIEELESLAAPGFWGSPHDRITLELGLDPNEARAWETRLSRYYSSCGCEVGSAFLLVALGVYVVALALSFDGLSSVGWEALGMGGMIAFAAAASGKLVGLAYARRRFRATIQVLTTAVTEKVTTE